MIRSARSVFRSYLLPGLLVQSVIVAGGYGTGREIAEFFLARGPLGGLLAMLLVTTGIWSVVAAATFELARRRRLLDYRAFFRVLLGRAWWLFEAGYVALMLVVLAVVGAAAGEILGRMLGLPYALGVGAITAAIALLVLGGSAWIERALAGWSAVLYLVFCLVFVGSALRFGPGIAAALAAAGPEPGWWIGGVEYAAYNVIAAPVILFGLRHVETRRQAIGAGLLSGPIAILPALFLYLPMTAHHPGILADAVPVDRLLEALGSRPLRIAYQVVLLGTLIETGTGMIHAVNERIAGTLRERGAGGLPAWVRPATALVALGLAAALSSVGLIGLVARGYGTLTWYFLLVFVLPVLTRGAWLAFGRRARHSGPP